MSFSLQSIMLIWREIDDRKYCNLYSCCHGAKKKVSRMEYEPLI